MPDVPMERIGIKRPCRTGRFLITVCLPAAAVATFLHRSLRCFLLLVYVTETTAHPAKQRKIKPPCPFRLPVLSTQCSSFRAFASVFEDSFLMTPFRGVLFWRDSVVSKTSLNAGLVQVQMLHIDNTLLTLVHKEKYRMK